MRAKQIAFAVPARITNLTGGTIYDRRVIEALPDHGVEVRLIELPGSFPDPSPHEMEQACDLLASVPPDVPLIVDGLAFGALSLQVVRRLRAPLVPLVHHPLAEESGLSEPVRSHLRQTERANLAFARRVLVPSAHTADCLGKTYDVPNQIIVVAQPGADQPTINAMASDPPHILSVGIQVPRKGHDVLMRALAEIKDLCWQAVIVGEPLIPDYAEELLRLRSMAGLEDRVSMPGKVEQSDLQTLFATATLFALATRYEGYGIVFDEALVHGLPIVSCRTGSVTDTVPRNAGLLVPPDTPDLFADALREMLTDHPRRAACAEVARFEGRRLPTWSDTAKTVAGAMQDLPGPRVK